MTPQAWMTLVGVAVAGLTFVLGTLYVRASNSGKIEADVANLKALVTSQQEVLTRHGNQIAALEQAGKSDASKSEDLEDAGRAIAKLETEIAGLARALDERYDSSRKLYERFDELAREVTRIDTRCQTLLKSGNTSHHHSGPVRAGIVESGDNGGDQNT